MVPLRVFQPHTSTAPGEKPPVGSASHCSCGSLPVQAYPMSSMTPGLLAWPPLSSRKNSTASLATGGVPQPPGRVGPFPLLEATSTHAAFINSTHPPALLLFSLKPPRPFCHISTSVPMSCYDKCHDWSGGQGVRINSGHSLLVDLEAVRPRSRRHQLRGLVRAASWLTDSTFSLCPHVEEGAGGLLGSLL